MYMFFEVKVSKCAHTFCHRVLNGNILYKPCVVKFFFSILGIFIANNNIKSNVRTQWLWTLTFSHFNSNNNNFLILFSKYVVVSFVPKYHYTLYITVHIHIKCHYSLVIMYPGEEAVILCTYVYSTRIYVRIYSLIIKIYILTERYFH